MGSTRSRVTSRLKTPAIAVLAAVLVLPLFVGATFLWVNWAITAFVGGDLAVLGWDMDGSLEDGFLWLFFLGPLIAFGLAAAAAAVVGGLVFGLVRATQRPKG